MRRGAPTRAVLVLAAASLVATTGAGDVGATTPPKPAGDQMWHLDPTFGDDGMQTTFFSADPEQRERAGSSALQPDGKIVVAGTSDNYDGAEDDILVARYLPDGSLDQGFGDAGSVIISVGVR